MIAQFFRYVVIGLVINLLGFVAYLLFTYWGATPKLTMSALYLVGASLSFFWNRKLTFSDNGSVLSSGIRYVMAHIFGYFLNFLILLTFVDLLEYPHQFVQGNAMFVVAIFLFVAFKLFVYRAPQAAYEPKAP